MEQNNVLAVLAAALAPYLSQYFGSATTGTAQQASNAQVQAGTQSQQAFGNPAGMQGATNGFGGTQFQAPAQNVSQAGTVGQQQGGLFGGNPNQAAQPSVTPDMIQQLITPLVQNERVKAALTAQMQEMGIQNLADARPEQLPEMYQRFQNVQQQAEQAGLLGGAQQAVGGTPSII